MPLVFPYQLMCVDTRDRACLEKYDPEYPVADPNKPSSGVFGDMTQVATDNRFLVFETRNGSTITYGMLCYESGIRSDFVKESDLWNAATEAGYKGSHVLQKIDDLFSVYYDWAKTFVEPKAGSDGKPASQS